MLTEYLHERKCPESTKGIEGKGIVEKFRNSLWVSLLR
jgi:hypothetical protein